MLVETIKLIQRNSRPEVFDKRVILKILQNVPENTSDDVFFDKGVGLRSATIYVFVSITKFSLSNIDTIT